MKPIRLSKHTTGYLGSRGFTAVEVEEAIRTATWGPAELGRLAGLEILDAKRRFGDEQTFARVTVEGMVSSS